MKRTLNILTVLCLLMFAGTVNAQRKGETTMSLNYNYSLPLSGFKNDIITHNSPRGFSGSIMYSFNNKLSAGLFAGFQDYYQKYPRDVYDLSKDQQISAVLSNSVQTTTILAKVKYSFLGATASPIKPYISAGAGANMISFTQYLGEFGGTDNSVSFTAQGGAGLSIPFGKFSLSGFQIGANYNYVPYKRNGYSDLNSVDFYAGLHFRL
ncbi:MAG: outer membrane beta-barrel protein [Chitinophagaceae bacterium]